MLEDLKSNGLFARFLVVDGPSLSQGKKDPFWLTKYCSGRTVKNLILVVAWLV